MMRRTALLHSRVHLAAILVVTVVNAGNLPYNPASFLVSTANPSIAYLLAPVSSVSQQFQLGRLDLSKPITTTEASYTTVFSQLPFLDDTKPIAFVAVIDGDGVITALAGDCSQGNNPAKIWRLDTGGSSGKIASAWTQSSASSSGKLVAEFISSAITFSSSATGATSDYKMYTFGGMCPLNNATRSTWTSAAMYHASMNKFGVSTNQVDVGLIAARNSPVAQAGHTLIPLTPTFSNRSDGSQTSQQTFLLLGGHTNSAFLNLSQTALFSLPQETWTYLPITVSSDKTDIASIEPRSGHTATLSSDGKQIVVFGGWIGDVNTPASPQTVILNVADGYGGSGSWSWSAPASKNTALQPTGGLYGHAAVMLSGNVMLVTGGYTISSTGTTKRDIGSPVLNTRSYLYNVTSNSWITNYNAPAPIKSPSGSGSKTGQKIGIGIGLTLAFLAIFGLLTTFVWYKRRVKRRREQIEADLDSIKEKYMGEDWDVERTDDERYYRHVGAASMAPPPAAFNRGRSRHNRTALTGDNLNQISGPKRSNTGGRGPYPYERSRNRDAIHPIIEGNEDSSENLARQGKITVVPPDGHSGIEAYPEMTGGHSTRARPRAGSSVSSCHEQELEIENWSTQWAKAGTQLMRGADDSSPSSEMGRTSPTKSEHTVTSLTSVSPRTSYVQPTTSGAVSIVRSLSHRSAAILSSLANPFSTSLSHSNTTSSSASQPTGITVSTSVYSRKGPSRQDPAHIDFARVQAESKLLLGTHPSQTRGNQRRSQDHDRSPVRAARPSNAGGWVGSVRRVIGMSSSTSAPRSSSLTTESTTTRNNALKQHNDSIAAATATASAVASGALTVPQSGADTVVPRRAASDAAFWKRRRGAKDWATNDARASANGGADDDHDDNDDDDDDAEWDVETAAQDRVVQLMFTVPRERLRVVNADVDGRSIVSVEERPAVPAKDVERERDNWEKL